MNTGFSEWWEGGCGIMMALGELVGRETLVWQITWSVGFDAMRMGRSGCFDAMWADQGFLLSAEDLYHADMQVCI
jgi:hypothetical protein